MRAIQSEFTGISARRVCAQHGRCNRCHQELPEEEPAATPPPITLDLRSSPTSCRLSSQQLLIEAKEDRSLTLPESIYQESPVTKEELASFSVEWFRPSLPPPSSGTGGLALLEVEGAAEQLFEEINFPKLLLQGFQSS